MTGTERARRSRELRRLREGKPPRVVRLTREEWSEEAGRRQLAMMRAGGGPGDVPRFEPTPNLSAGAFLRHWWGEAGGRERAEFLELIAKEVPDLVEGRLGLMVVPTEEASDPANHGRINLEMSWGEASEGERRWFMEEHGQLRWQKDLHINRARVAAWVADQVENDMCINPDERPGSIVMARLMRVLRWVEYGEWDRFGYRPPEGTGPGEPEAVTAAADGGDSATGGGD
jgi:hypothetical protein